MMQLILADCEMIPKKLLSYQKEPSKRNHPLALVAGSNQASIPAHPLSLRHMLQKAERMKPININN